jgi:HK97 family phage major capsid protein
MIKSICDPALSGTGTWKGTVYKPAVVGVPSASRTMNGPISEQITALQRDLTTKSGRFQELIDLEGKDGSLEDAQVVERDELQKSIETISGRVSQLKTLEKAQALSATQVYTKANSADTTEMAYRPQIQGPTPPKLEPGQAYARAVICKLQGLWQQKDAVHLAKQFYPNHEALHLFLKEDVPAMSTRDTTWAGSLVYPENLASEFVDWLRPQTIIGRLPTQPVPFNVRMNRQTSAGAGYWVGEGRAKPLTWWGYSATTFGEYKVANIAVLTQEQARFSSPNAELLVRNELGAACLERLDRDFVDPNKAISTGVSPASITNGIVNLDSTGTALTNVLQDVGKLLNVFADANIAPTHWIMSVRNAIALSLMVTSSGTRAFPEMNANGGTFAGLPVVVSNYVTHGTPLNNFVILVSAPNIWVADDGGFSIDASREASLEMNDAPTMTSGPLGSPTGASGSVVVSMFQTNSVAIRCERFINWARKRPEAVAWMDDVNWAAV